MPMKLEQMVGAKAFKIVDANGVQAGEARIIPQGKWPTQVELRTWRNSGRWRAEQRVVVDLNVIAAIMSESDPGKS